MVSFTLIFVNLLLLRTAALANNQIGSGSGTTTLPCKDSVDSIPHRCDFSIDQLHVTLKRFPLDKIPYVIRSNGQPKFKNGAFEFNKRVLNRLRSADRELAQRLSPVAPKATLAPIPELLRRQDSGNATTSASTSTEVSTVTDSSTASTSTVVVVDTTSESPPSRSSEAPLDSESPTPEPHVTEHTTESPSTQDESPTSSPDSANSSPTSSGGMAKTSNSSNNSGNSKSTSSSSPPPKPTTKQVLETTTLPNGDTSTRTHVTVITPASATATDKGAPSLQSGSAQRPHHLGREAAALVAGAFGAAWML